MEILTKGQPEKKHRLVILTDMENEPDDSQTMVRLLIYSNEIDIEALVAVTSTHLRNEVFPESIHDRVKAYGIVRDNLTIHTSGWPTEEYLLSKVASGPVGYGMDSVGDGKNTDGSDLLISVVDKDDPRPVRIAINAGANTLAQSLWDVRRTRSEAEFQKFISKIQVYDDSGQDNCGAWICHNFPDIFYIRSHPQVFALYGPKNGMGPQVCAPLTEWQWAEKHVRTRHGILGALYPQRVWEHGRVAFLEGGGTTSWIGLVNKGLYDPDQISWGGWGGRFSWEKAYVAAGQSRVAPAEEPYKPFAMYPQAADTWADGDTVYENDVCAPIWRWRRAYTNDFQARMDWCVADCEHANHNPVAAFYDDTNRTIVRIKASPGEDIALDASQSSDPDGDPITFNWYIYPEAGTYGGTVHIDDSHQSIAKMQMPNDAGGKQIHVILEVTDENSIVNLTSYRRIVIDVG
jgi:hypothetical protein